MYGMGWGLLVMMQGLTDTVLGMLGYMWRWEEKECGRKSY
jgi:hypothetical protein